MLTPGNGDQTMASQGSSEGIAYCGLSCTVCSHASEGCVGCRAGGGPDTCLKRECCTGKRLDGCWQCQEFPCKEGFFADEAWRGLCIGLVEAIREYGPERFAQMIQTALGDTFDYGYLRFKEPDEVREMLVRGSGE